MTSKMDGWELAIESPIFHAVLYGERVDVLAATRRNPNLLNSVVCSEHGEWTAVSLSAQRQRIDFLEVLSSAGADISLGMPSSARVAARLGANKVLQWLLVHIEPSELSYVFCDAARAQSTECLSLLIEAGADTEGAFDTSRPKGWCPDDWPPSILSAVESWYRGVHLKDVLALLEQAGVTASGNLYDLHRHERIQQVDGDINAQLPGTWYAGYPYGFHDLTLLHVAVAYGYTDVVEWLLNKGADVNARAGRGLLLPEAWPNGGEAGGETPLFHAVCRKENLACLELLLQHGAHSSVKAKVNLDLCEDIHETGTHELTALEFANLCGEGQAACELLKQPNRE